MENFIDNSNWQRKLKYFGIWFNRCSWRCQNRRCRSACDVVFSIKFLGTTIKCRINSTVTNDITDFRLIYFKGLQVHTTGQTSSSSHTFHSWSWEYRENYTNNFQLHQQNHHFLSSTQLTLRLFSHHFIYILPILTYSELSSRKWRISQLQTRGLEATGKTTDLNWTQPWRFPLSS